MARSLLELLKSQELKEATNVTREKSNQDALLVGAAPLLLGVLGGFKGNSADIVADVFTSEGKRQQEREKSLFDIMQKKEAVLEKAEQDAKNPTGMKKRYQQAPYEGPDGNILMGVFDTFEGKFAKGNALKGYRRSIKFNPVKGELDDFSGATGVGRELRTDYKVNPTPFNMKEEKDVERTQTGIKKDKVFIDNTKAYNAANRAIPLLLAGNPVADSGITTIFPRMFGEVGNLAVQEQVKFQGSPEIMRRWERLKEKALEGDLPGMDRSDLIEVSRIMAAYSKTLLEGVVERETDATERRTGISGERLKKTTEPFMPKEVDTSGIAEKIRTTKKEGQIVEKFYKGKMRKFKKNSDGSWETAE